jgi:DNA-binding FadR family transcriptional regulator
MASYQEIFLKTMPDPRKILECVQDRDAEGARQVMLQHLERARQIQDQVIQQNNTAS